MFNELGRITTGLATAAILFLWLYSYTYTSYTSSSLTRLIRPEVAPKSCATHATTITITAAPKQTQYTLTQNRIETQVDNAEKYDFVVIGLHGYTGNGEAMRAYFKDYLGGMKMNGFEKRIKWIWPTAYDGTVHSWYQLTHKTFPLTLEAIMNLEEDDSHLFYTSGQIKDIINEELRHGIFSKRIIIWGFSQGCVISLLTGLTTSVPLGGIIGFNGYLPLRRNFTNYFDKVNTDTPVWLIAGDVDPIIHPQWVIQSAQYMQNNLSMPNVKVTTYNISHEMSKDAFPLWREWVIKRFKQVESAEQKESVG